MTMPYLQRPPLVQAWQARLAVALAWMQMVLQQLQVSQEVAPRKRPALGLVPARARVSAQVRVREPMPVLALVLVPVLVLVLQAWSMASTQLLTQQGAGLVWRQPWGSLYLLPVLPEVPPVLPLQQPAWVVLPASR